MLNVFSKVFGTRNDRVVKKYRKRANEITLLEDKYKKMSDDELKNEFNNLKKLVQNEEKSLDDILNDTFAIVRE
ncbi:hypothetical protein, partial [Aliarcobacter skirrowii]